MITCYHVKETNPLHGKTGFIFQRLYPEVRKTKLVGLIVDKKIGKKIEILNCRNRFTCFYPIDHYPQQDR